MQISKISVRLRKVSYARFEFAAPILSSHHEYGGRVATQTQVIM
jgi:hypothetical protein